MNPVYVHILSSWSFLFLLIIQKEYLQAQSYDASAAAIYADMWTCDRLNTSCDPQMHNPAYHYYGNTGGDCVNYVSQCLIAGGLHLHAGPDADNLGCIPFCDNLHTNLIVYQSVQYQRLSGTTPSWFVKGDVVMFGNSSDPWKHGVIAVTSNPPLLDGHTIHRYHRPVSFFYPGDYPSADFYHINNITPSLNCSNAIPLSCGVTYHGSSSSASSYVTYYGCQTYNGSQWDETGPERIHEITTTSQGDITATISNFIGDLDVWIIKNCDPNNCNAFVNPASATWSNAPAGTYYIIVDAGDGSGGSYDLLVTGNCSGAPNLTKQTDNLSIAGNTLTISTTVRNNGTGYAAATQIGYYLSVNSNYSIINYYLGTQTVSSINAGSNKSQTSVIDLCSLSIPNGIYYLGYFIDFNNSVAESNETDNSWYWPSPITVSCNPTLSYDDPCLNPISLTAGTVCSFSTYYTNVGATPTSSVAEPSCANYQGGDVWLSIVVPSSGHLIFDSDAGTLTDGAMAVYEGSCSSLNEIDCNDDASANGAMPYLDLTGLPIGQTIYIRFWGYGGEAGTFQICVYSPTGCTPPSPPTITFGSSTCPGSVASISPSLTWNNVASAEGYYVAISKYPYGSVNIVNYVDCDAGTPYTVSSGLEPGMLYRWNMTANSSSGCSNNSCESGFSSTNYFHVPPAITANGATTFCQSGNVTLSISPNPSPGSGATQTYQWYRNGSTVGTNSSTYSATQSGNYTVATSYSGSTVTSCTGTVLTSQSNSISVTVNPIPTASISPSTVSICSGASTSLNASGGGTYSWSTGSTNSSITVSPTSTTTYTVTVTSNGCSASTSRTVTVSNTGSASISPPTVSVCNGASTTLTASGGSSYSWSTGATTSTITVSPSSTTIYTVTATSSGCLATASRTVTVNQLPNATISPTTASICIGSNVTLTASGGASYSWSNGNSTASITVSPTSITAYTVTVTNSSGCTASTSRTVSINPGLTASISPAIASVCSGKNITLTVSGGTTYSWSTGATSTSITVNPNSTTNYTVTITDGGTCSATSSRTVTVNANPTASITPATVSICSGVSATLSASGGSSYSWSQGSITSSITVSPLLNTSYTVTVTNVNSCTATASRNITVTNLTASVYATPLPCFGFNTGTAVINAINGAFPISYSWSTGATTSGIAGLSAGTYCATAMDADGCTIDACETIAQPPQTIITAYPDTSIQSGGIVNLNVSGCSSCSYAWSPSVGLSSTGIKNPTATPAVTTTYSVTATESNGCTTTDDVTIFVGDIQISGLIRTQTLVPIPAVTVTLAGSGTGNLVANGNYLFNVMQGGSYAVTPSKNNSSGCDLGCVTTLDILFMRRHILGISAFNSPYLAIAADVNASCGVTTADLLSVRACILQINTAFPNGKWVFVPDDFVFTNINPLTPCPFPTYRSYVNLTSSKYDQNFIGIALGDVNNSCDESLAKMDGGGEILLQIDEFHVPPRTEIVAPIKVKDFQNISGYQFTLSWDASVLSLLEVSNKSLQGYYGEHRKDEGYLTTTWYDEMTKAVTLDDDAVAFELKFKVVGANGSFSPITIGSELTASEAYNENLDLLNIVPQNGMVKVGDGSNRFHSATGEWNLSVQPNPFTNTTNIIFTLPQDETVSIEIYDLLGRQVKSVQSGYRAGEHAIEWSGDNDAGVPLTKGLYHIRMTAGDHVESAKVLLWTE